MEVGMVVVVEVEVEIEVVVGNVGAIVAGVV